jgi:acyl carrier protein
METQAIRSKLLQDLAHVAPELLMETLDDELSLQDQFDLDSVDMLNYIIRVGEDFQLNIPNQDYRVFLSIGSAVRYLEKSLPSVLLPQ